MKKSDSFDPRRLRPSQPGRWRWRLVAAFAALVATLGILATLAGAAALLRRQPATELLHLDPASGGVLLGLGLLGLWLGVRLWRTARARARRNAGLSLSPRLLKKRD